MNDGDEKTPVQLDSLIHEESRLRMVTALNECDVADFNFLLTTTGLTRGNLSAHMAKLVKAEYVDETKEFVGRKPHTTYRLTDKGRRAYKQYVEMWRRLTDPQSGDWCASRRRSKREREL